MDIQSIDSTTKYSTTKSATTNTQAQATDVLLDKLNLVGNSGSAATSITKNAPAPIQDIQKAANTLNDLVKSHNISVEFDVRDNGGQVVIVVKDTKTDEIIRQIPSEQAIDFSRANDPKQGLIYRNNI